MARLLAILKSKLECLKQERDALTQAIAEVISLLDEPFQIRCITLKKTLFIVTISSSTAVTKVIEDLELEHQLLKEAADFWVWLTWSCKMRLFLSSFYWTTRRFCRCSEKAYGTGRGSLSPRLWMRLRYKIGKRSESQWQLPQRDEPVFRQTIAILNNISS